MATAKKGRRKKPARLAKKDYEKELRSLQVELLQLEEWVRHRNLRVVVLFEGRDTAGKGVTHPLRTGAQGKDQASGTPEAQLQPTPKKLAAHGSGQVRGGVKVKVKDVPPGRLLLVEPQTTVAEVARLMREDDCDSVAVMSKGRVVGIVTEKDLVQAWPTASIRSRPKLR